MSFLAHESAYLDDGASIGANATIICGVTIGEWAFIAAGTVVTRDVTPYALMAGVPARRIGWAGECGVSLVFVGERATYENCGKSYRLAHEERIGWAD